MQSKAWRSLFEPRLDDACGQGWCERSCVGTSNVTRLLEPDPILLFQTTSWLHTHDTASHTLPQASHDIR
jgi:hypothetical protein